MYYIIMTTGDATEMMTHMMIDITKTRMFVELCGQCKQLVDRDFVKLMAADNFDERYEIAMDLVHTKVSRVNYDFWLSDMSNHSRLEECEIVGAIFDNVWDYFNEKAKRICTNYINTQDPYSHEQLVVDTQSVLPCDVER